MSRPREPAWSPFACRGRVVDADGCGVGGALVLLTTSNNAFILPAPGNPSVRFARDTFAAETEPDGRFRIEGERCDPSYLEVKLLAFVGDRVSAPLEIDVPDEPNAEIELVLHPAMPLDVEVRDAHGQPVPDAEVLCLVSAHDDDDRGGYCWMKSRTDATGLSRDIVVARGARVRAGCRARHPAFGNTPTIHLAVIEDETPCVVRLAFPATRTARGLILDPDGDPVAGFSVAPRLTSPPASHDSRRGTDADGRFELHGVPLDCTLLDVCAPGRFTPRHCIELTDRDDVGEVRLPPEVSLTLQVVGRDCQPMQNCELLVAPPGCMGMKRGWDLEPRNELRLDGLADIEWWVHVEATDTDGIRLTQEFGGLRARAEAHVLRVTGAGNLLVRLHPAGRPQDELSVTGLEVNGADVGWGGEPRARSTMRLLREPGKWRGVVVTADGFEPCRVGDIEVSPTERTVLDVELTPVAQPAE